MLKIIIVLIALFFAIPAVWSLTGIFVGLWMEMLEQIANGINHITWYIYRHLSTIHLLHDDGTGNGLIWDYKTKTMYGHPIMATEKNEE